MRDPKRIEPILYLIRKIWKQNPDWRLCQLLSNMSVAIGWKNFDLFYLEDDMLKEGLSNYLISIRNEMEGEIYD